MYKSIALVDLSCLFKRIFEASPNKGAENTLDALVRIAERVEHTVLCLDAPPYKRKEIFPEYKAHREEPTTTERYQKRWLYEQLEERGFQMAKVPGQEADDVIATLARIYGESCPDVWLVGADKDLAQCVTDNVRVLCPPHGERAEEFRGPKEVKAKYEVWPAQIPLWLALVGDKSDNIPGVKGIGQVKAAGLIGEYKTLTGIAENLGAIGGRMGKDLAEGWEQLVLSLSLTTLDAKLPLDAEALLVKKEPKVAETMAPKVELEFDGFMGNATPMPEAALPGPGYTDAPVDDDGPVQEPRRPIIGKDPRADEFLRQEAAAREQARNADRAAAEQHEREQKREEEWREQRRREVGAIPEAKLANMPASAPAPKVTEAEFDPIGKSPGASGPLPPKAVESADKPGLVKTKPTPDYGMVTSKLEPEDLRSAEVIAKWLDAGGLYSKKFSSPAAIVTVIMYGKALGLPMMAALSGFHIIEGKPSASADLIRALAMRSQKCKYFKLISADDTQATWETWHKDHDEPARLTYTIGEAQKAGLRGGNWESRKKQMLVKTCSTILARWVFTIETMGLYCPEEMGDYVDTVGEAA
jgi:5'-3' exonuclease